MLIPSAIKCGQHGQMLSFDTDLSTYVCASGCAVDQIPQDEIRDAAEMRESGKRKTLWDKLAVQDATAGRFKTETIETEEQQPPLDSVPVSVAVAVAEELPPPEPSYADLVELETARPPQMPLAAPQSVPPVANAIIFDSMADLGLKLLQLGPIGIPGGDAVVALRIPETCLASLAEMASIRGHSLQEYVQRGFTVGCLHGWFSATE